MCRNHIQFILLLDGHEPPDHCTIARFRSGAATGKAIEGLFWQYVNVLTKKGWIDRDELYIDGTKIESRANRYTFVWRKTVERELGKIREKARSLLGLESGYATKGKLAEQVKSLEKEISEEGLTVQKGRGHHKPAKIRERDERKALLERWESYEQKKGILGDKRNSYSKTNPDATFMYMKDDHMRNGQLKHNRKFVRFLTAGNVKVACELFLLAISQNIRKAIIKCNTGRLENHILQPASLLNF